MRAKSGSCRWPAALGVLALLTVAAPAGAGTVYFKVGELPGREVHHDSYVLPLTRPQDIEHARDLLTRGPEAAGGSIVVADIAAGADGINRDLDAPGQPEWSWHVTDVQGFADLGIEILDGWPAFVERDVAGWVRNTGGRIGFWNYTVVAELKDFPPAGPAAPPPAVPLPPAAGGAMLAALAAAAAVHSARRQT